MKTFLVVSVFLAASVLAFGQASKSDTAATEQTVTQLERDWSQVGLKKENLDKDLKTLDRIVADDWVGLDFQGTANTKAQSMANLKSGAATTQSFELGPLKVRVFGNTAIVTGSDTEKSTYKGKDSSGKYVWTDVFVNRNGRWQAVASETTKVEK
ncbi:MAG: nuclear transport factor 2 family protein [Bryobacteraceae bacterium]|jgi:ketosteroid isomerase-like protein